MSRFIQNVHVYNIQGARGLSRSNSWQLMMMIIMRIMCQSEVRKIDSYFVCGWLRFHYLDYSANIISKSGTDLCNSYCHVWFISLRLGWFGHVQRMSDTRTVKKIFNWKPQTKNHKEDPSTDGRITLNRTFAIWRSEIGGLASRIERNGRRRSLRRPKL
jgi:hypothetical protein